MNASEPSRPRPQPTVSFSLSQDHMQQLRAIAERRGVSVSQVAREAFEAALDEWESAGRIAASDPAPEPNNRAETPAAAPSTRARWPRQLRRRATHNSAPKLKAARPIP